MCEIDFLVRTGLGRVRGGGGGGGDLKLMKHRERSCITHLHVTDQLQGGRSSVKEQGCVG